MRDRLSRNQATTRVVADFFFYGRNLFVVWPESDAFSYPQPYHRTRFQHEGGVSEKGPVVSERRVYAVARLECFARNSRSDCSRGTGAVAAPGNLRVRAHRVERLEKVF